MVPEATSPKPDDGSEYTQDYLAPEAAPYEAALDAATREIDAQWSLWQQQSLNGNTGTLSFTIDRPPLRGGKHARVALVGITDGANGSQLDCVLRDSPEDADTYRKRVAERPAIAEYLPHLYGVKNGWVIMERLFGAELTDVEDRMRDDPTFVQQYAHHAWRALADLSDAGVALHDVGFSWAHNVMVDPATGRVRFVEQTTLAPAEDGRDASSLIMQQLTNELRGITSARDSNDARGRSAFVFSLLKEAFASRSIEDFYIRPTYITARHPGFRHHAWVAGMDDEHVTSLLASVPDDKLDQLTIQASGNAKTEIFVPGFVNAVLSDDRAAFDSYVHSSSYMATLDDPDDPRSQPIVIT